MTKRLSNEQVNQRIMETNSDLKRYLNLAPSFKLTPPKRKPAYSSKLSIPSTPFPWPTLRP